MQEYRPRRRKVTLGSFHESLVFVLVQNTDLLSDHNEKLLQQKTHCTELYSHRRNAILYQGIHC